MPSYEQDLKAQSISPISIVVCNLYPFTSTISKPDCTLADAVEEIDIGGVTLLRAAAKNHERVSVLSDPADYTEFLQSWQSGNGDVGQAIRSKLALKAFEMTSRYDEAISGYFREQYASAELTKEKLAGPVQRIALRYGANPHQKPAQAFVTEGELPFKGEWSNSTYSCVISNCRLVYGSTLWVSGIHQPLGCPQLLRPRQRTPGGSESSCCCIFQTCFSSRRCRWSRVRRDREESLRRR